MKVSDFKAGGLFAFEAAAELWGKPLKLYVELNDDYDPGDTLASYIEVINDRHSRLEIGRQAVIDALAEDVIEQRLGLAEGQLEALLEPEEMTVYCDDGRDNVWTDLFVKIGESSVQVSLSPDNSLECRGVCG